MTRDVLVSITGARFSEHDKEDVEMIIGGDYFWKNGKHYVLYEEVMEESGEVVKNTVKITPDSMDILKKGSINTHMVFQKGQKNVSCYLTPVGELTVGIETRDIEITETEASLYYDRFIKRFKQNQYKRLASPECVKYYSFSFGARGDYRFPGDMK